MKLSPPQPEIAVPQGEQESNLLASLPFEIGQRAFGKSWAIRAEILAQMETGTPTLYRIAKDYGVSRQYVGRLAQRVKKTRGT
jgi:hypothetical protein